MRDFFYFSSVKLIATIFLLFSINLFAQTDSTTVKTFDSNETMPFRKSRVIGVSTGIGVAWAGSMIGLSQVWYKNMEMVPWHSFDDSREWLQMDKMGHAYTANKIANLTYGVYSWAGLKNRDATLVSFGIGMGYLFTLESLDAFGKDWGFSWSDMAANTIGGGLFLTQQLIWKEQRIITKFSMHPTKYAVYRPQVLGSNFAERLLKDYNGQTYWLSVSPGSFMKNSRFPSWLCFSLGYSIDGKLNGEKDIYNVQSHGETITFHAKREFLLSLDIDFSKLPIKNKVLKAFVRQFNYLKLPFPALILSGDKLKGSWLYF